MSRVSGGWVLSGEKVLSERDLGENTLGVHWF
jgi:hypothetical protein